MDDELRKKLDQKFGKKQIEDEFEPEIKRATVKKTVFQKQIGLKQSIAILGSVVTITGVLAYYLITEVVK